MQSQNDGAIAQLVEQRTENPCVPGSIPGGTTQKAMQKCRAFLVSGGFICPLRLSLRTFCPQKAVFPRKGPFSWIEGISKELVPQQTACTISFLAAAVGDEEFSSKRVSFKEKTGWENFPQQRCLLRKTPVHERPLPLQFTNITSINYTLSGTNTAKVFKIIPYRVQSKTCLDSNFAILVKYC